MHFDDPRFLAALILIPLLTWRYLRSPRHGNDGLRFSSIAALEVIRSSWTLHVRHVLFGLQMVALGLVIFALARPQQGIQSEESVSEAVDIMLALDASGSMAAEDFEPNNRFSVAQRVLTEFVTGMRHDRVGLVIFAAQAWTRCPLTLDYPALSSAIDAVQLGSIEDGTAIGSALATCLNRLRHSSAASKVIVLVTDGVNNRGEIQPIDAANMARSLGVRIHTVGVGSSGSARFPVNDPVYGKTYVDMRVEIDEPALEQIAATTGGLYYRATDTPSLEKIFTDIGRMEKTPIRARVFTRYRERFSGFLWPALGLVLAVALAEWLRFGKIP